MKKFILLFALGFTTISSNAQSERFIAAMKKNLSEMDSSFQSPEKLLAVANNFERIALAEKNQWLPYYFAAFCQVNLGFMQKDKSKVDPIADKASLLINVADSLSPNNSEISCIKSMIASCHMMVDPMKRWMEFGKESSEQMETAMAQDASNPRPYFLKGQSLKYTPEQFGGGCTTAKPEFEKAMEKYGQFKPASEIAPNWGREITAKLLKDCQ